MKDSSSMWKDSFSIWDFKSRFNEYWTSHELWFRRVYQRESLENMVKSEGIEAIVKARKKESEISWDSLMNKDIFVLSSELERKSIREIHGF